MGEVGAVIPEKQSESPAIVNGDVNGLCKLSDEQMDVDTEEDSQVSSENGISEVSQDIVTSKLPIISKSESLSVVTIAANLEIEDADSISIHSDESSQDNLKDDDDNLKRNDNDEGDASRDNQTIEDGNSRESTNEGNSRDNAKMDEISHDNSNGQLVEDENSQEDLNEAENSRERTVEENSQSSDRSAKSKDATKENGVVAPEAEQSPSDGESQSSVSKNARPEQTTKENGELNGSTKITSAPNISDDITIIESDDDDEPPPSSVLPPPSNVLPPPSQNKSGLMIASVQENVEQMEVDSTTNGTAAESNSKPKPKLDNSDDSPVIIPSDSESEDDSPPKSSANISANESATKQSQEDEDMSDKDDCVVIEDDDKKEKDEEPIRRPPNRQRKSIVRTREVDDDDDIAEIVDSPAGQPPSKRARTTISPASISMAGQIGTITIKDARSLMGPFVDVSAKQSFQQQFAQTAASKGTKEAPGLVIIDSNSLLKPGLSPQNAAKQLSMMQITGISPQGLFPNNIRPSLAPLSTPPKLVPTSPAITLPVSNPTLLPALTDDMFVLEAPSFIVPYIYEKPPPDNLKEVVANIQAEIDKIKQQLKDAGESVERENKNELDDSKLTDSLKVGEGAEKKQGSKSKKKKTVNGNESPDESWDELDASTDDEASDGESRTKVLIKEDKSDLDVIKNVITADVTKTSPATPVDDKKNLIKTENYFESPLGKFFIDIGINLVQEYVQTDLLRIQKRKQHRVGQPTPEIQLAIKSLQKNIETSKQRNEPFKFDIKRCEFCNFKSESALAMAHHYETPHMRQYLYKCNFCSFEIRPPHDILFHMEAVHNIKGRLEKALGYHQCPNCPFEENGKSKFARHVPVCAKKFRPEVNLQPPHDWEAPAKIPRIKPRHGLVGTATAYQAMAAQAAAQKAQLAAMAARATSTPVNTGANRNRGRPQQTVTRVSPATANVMRGNQQMRPQMPGMVLPNSYQIAGGQLIQQQQNTKKSSGQQPSISITPLPRQPGNVSNAAGLSVTAAMPAKPPAGMKPGQVPSGGKASFVICEICDGYIKDLEQLRNHMQWMHKVKIHPKMIYNRPPLNCQKCQFRFFTDQGLERHLLGSHGLVTSSMQEAANKGKDAGRCPVCGRMYQWKLLNHVSRDHHMTLKPAHLSYKCTVCTATFGMYKQFENHVYTAHSTVAKKAMDGKKNTSGSNSNNPMPSGSNSSGGSSKSGGATLSSLGGGDSLLKNIKINEEITIIPQPATKSRGSSSMNDYDSHSHIGKSSNKR